jgi:hypothetical protein
VSQTIRLNKAEGSPRGFGQGALAAHACGHWSLARRTRPRAYVRFRHTRRRSGTGHMGGHAKTSAAIGLVGLHLPSALMMPDAFLG